MDLILEVGLNIGDEKRGYIASNNNQLCYVFNEVTSHKFINFDAHSFGGIS